MDALGLAMLLGIGLAIGWAMLVAHTYLTLTRPPRRTYGWAVARSLPGDPSELQLPGPHSRTSLVWSAWSFQSRALDLPVWDIAGLDPRGPTVILTHGWSDSRVVMLGSGRVAAALPLVSRLIVWDLPGHGEAPGRCSLGLSEPEALRTLIERIAGSGSGGSGEREPPGARVVLWGFSLGSRISIEAAIDHPAVEAVIAEAPYTLPRTPAINVMRARALPYRTNLAPALAAIGLRHGAGFSLASGAGLAIDASRVACRVLVIHGQADRISPVQDGRGLAASARDGRCVEIEHGQHQSLWFAPETRVAAAAALSSFFARE